MPQPNELGKAPVPLCHETTLIAVIDMAGRRNRSWYRSPALKKINPDEVGPPEASSALA